MLRTEHLKSIRTKTLIVQGTRDPFGKPEEVKSYALAKRVELHWIELGDHPLADELRHLGLPKKPLSVMWTENMHGRFETAEKL